MLTADFLLERDRTAAPSPVTVEVKGSCSAPEEESVVKNSSNRVETWLKGSEFSQPTTNKLQSRKFFKWFCFYDNRKTLDLEKPEQQKDKSAWRKSTLNVPNSSEETKTSHRRDGYNHSDTRRDVLQPILETNDRKELIGALGKEAETDRLTLYLRKPAEQVPEPKTEPPLGNYIVIFCL